MLTMKVTAGSTKATTSNPLPLLLGEFSTVVSLFLPYTIDFHELPPPSAVSRVELQELLVLTDEVVALCYRPGTFKTSPLYRRLEFLHFKKTQIELTYSSFHDLHSAWADAVAQVFLEVVHDISNDGPAEHGHFPSYLSSTPAAKATSLSEVQTQDADVLSRLFVAPTAAYDESEEAQIL
ncbi:hypothetical protein SLS58_005379 [Diplodia intermedia]|uniref:Uncharacterized protein n=1 Tax=Diplodia intermedia TaxID=856260 RepID=A0ABR3TRM7_9PEZI